jgi:hypothetical protein
MFGLNCLPSSSPRLFSKLDLQILLSILGDDLNVDNTTVCTKPSLNNLEQLLCFECFLFEAVFRE